MTVTSSSSASRSVNNNPNKNRNSKIAVAQLCSTSSKWYNLLNVAKCAGWATTSAIPTTEDGVSVVSEETGQQGTPCSMLFLPECFGFIGSSTEQTWIASEQVEWDNQQSRTIATGATPKTFHIKNQNSAHITKALIQTVRNYAAMDANTIPSPSDGEYDALSLSEEEDQNLSLLDGLRNIAKASNLWISAGGIHIRADGDHVGEEGAVRTSNDSDISNRVYNTHVIIDNDGVIRSQYQKIHLFDVCIPGKVNLQESKSTKPGTHLVVCPDSPIGCLGVTVCYDLRFPEMYTHLTQTLGAQILLVPSAFTVPTGQAHWHTLLRARAIENQCYVIAAAQYGKHNDKRESYGHSLVVDPWGAIVADAGGVDSDKMVDNNVQQHHRTAIPTPGIVTCEIDLDLVHSVRERMPIQQHRTNAHF